MGAILSWISFAWLNLSETSVLYKSPIFCLWRSIFTKHSAGKNFLYPNMQGFYQEASGLFCLHR